MNEEVDRLIITRSPIILDLLEIFSELAPVLVLISRAGYQAIKPAR